jgi:hypothetical protein
MKMPAIIAAIVALSVIAATPARALDDEQWRAGGRRNRHRDTGEVYRS